MDDDVVDISSALESFLDEDPTLDDDTVDEPSEPVTEPKEQEEGESEDESEEDGEEEETEEEESDGEEEDNPSEPTIPEDALIDITIDGEEYEVNLAELRSGYLRNEDYVNKVQAQDAAYNEKLAALEEREAELVEQLKVAAVVSTGDLSKYERINWEALKQQDPDQYKTLRLEAIDAQERVNQMVERRKGIEAMHAQAQLLRDQAYAKAQMELAEKLVPGYLEEATRNALVKHAIDLGYTKEDVMNISDARHLLLLNNSRLLAEAVVRRKEAQESKRPPKELPPVVKPGQAVAKSSVDRKVSKQASERLKSEKSVDAAAAYLMTLDL